MASSDTQSLHALDDEHLWMLAVLVHGVYGPDLTRRSGDNPSPAPVGIPTSHRGFSPHSEEFWLQIRNARNACANLTGKIRNRLAVSEVTDTGVSAGREGLCNVGTA
jgi:hypothetical protein